MEPGPGVRSCGAGEGLPVPEGGRCPLHHLRERVGRGACPLLQQTARYRDGPPQLAMAGGFSFVSALLDARVKGVISGCSRWPACHGAASNPRGFSEGLRPSLLDGGSQQPQRVSVGLITALWLPPAPSSLQFSPLPARSVVGLSKETTKSPCTNNPLLS